MPRPRSTCMAVEAIGDVHIGIRAGTAAGPTARDRECPEDAATDLVRSGGTRAKAPRRFVRTTDSNHKRPVAENRLARDPEPSRPNGAWRADITSRPTGGGGDTRQGGTSASSATMPAARMWPPSWPSPVGGVVRSWRCGTGTTSPARRRQSWRGWRGTRMGWPRISPETSRAGTQARACGADTIPAAGEPGGDRHGELWDRVADELVEVKLPGGASARPACPDLARRASANAGRAVNLASGPQGPRPDGPDAPQRRSPRIPG